MPINNKSVLITGGTGFFGQKYVEVALRDYSPEKVIIFSRYAFKQLRCKTKSKSGSISCKESA